MATLTSDSAPATSASSPFRAPSQRIQLPRSNSRKSPPLAFERTPNDALIPLISPPSAIPESDPFDSMFLQDVVEKQAYAMQALHTAFAAEREAWACERVSLLARVANLEKLLRAQNGHSPAKSPIISPNGTVASPQTRAVSTTGVRLPSIAEDENLRPLSERRENAPRAISIPTIETVEEASGHQSRLSIDFSYNAAAQLDELGVTPPRSAKRKSELLDKSAKSGLARNRPPTPPPKDMTLTGVEDTPTRNNTHINALLTQSSDEEEDVALKGPLHMPELPSKPSANNFTGEMLVRKLEQIAQHPAENKPTIFSIPSPGLAIAEEDGVAAGLSPMSGILAAEAPLAPLATRDQTTQAKASPSVAADATSPTAAQTASHDSDHDEKFAQGGIRLKKKPSQNFGAPFGHLTGFGSLRKMS